MSSSRPSITYPTTHAAFEIQAALFIALRKRKIDVRGEVMAWATTGDAGLLRYGYCDLVVFDAHQQARILIEVKADQKEVLAEQRSFYAALGLPTLYCLGKLQIKPTMLTVIQQSRHFEARYTPHGRLSCRFCGYLAQHARTIERHIQEIHPIVWRAMKAKSYQSSSS